MRCAALCFALSMALAAAALGQRTSYQPDPAWKAPANAAARTNPLAGNPKAADGGRKLFLRNCAECHGNEARGIDRAADFTLPVVQDQTDGTLFWKISNGNPGRGMPAWSRLPEAQRWQLVLFIRSLAK